MGPVISDVIPYMDNEDKLDILMLKTLPAINIAICMHFMHVMWK